MSEQEEIQYCLKCSKACCNNCLTEKGEVKTKAKQFFLWKGKEYTVTELANIRGLERSSMWRRIHLGGVDFAMSDIKNIKEWKKKQEEVSK